VGEHGAFAVGGSINPLVTSAAGKVTPSSSKSPVFLHFAVGDLHFAMMVLRMLACQMRTVTIPLLRHFKGRRSFFHIAAVNSKAA